MIKYIPQDTSVVFAEIPDEITLAINISNCPHHCPGCHSPYLRDDIGEELTYEVIDRLIKDNNGITCVAFMGEGNDLDSIFRFGLYIHNEYSIKVAIYCGSEDLPERFWREFDYIKLGGFDLNRGPLNNPNTNQRMYQYNDCMKDAAVVNGRERKGWKNITEKFWR
jgi:anaerobic ribonucleoside-triphosphate reductase activating protein